MGFWFLTRVGGREDMGKLGGTGEDDQNIFKFKIILNIKKYNAGGRLLACPGCQEPK